MKKYLFPLIVFTLYGYQLIANEQPVTIVKYHLRQNINYYNNNDNTIITN